ncbi:MAG TPA: hypothetical protein DCQ98_17070 [Planctomycetaceae bacterium]|nr:hypothetical protein [Planctomycetaceae bacterium]
MPIQFRQARGKIESLQAKIRQIDVKLGFVADKVNVELSAAAANLDAALRSIEQDRIQLETAGQALELARLRFEEGDIDLIMLNIYEQAVTDAELNLIYAQAAAFVAELDYLAAIGDLVPATEWIAVGVSSRPTLTVPDAATPTLGLAPDPRSRRPRSVRPRRS